MFSDTSLELPVFFFKAYIDRLFLSNLMCVYSRPFSAISKWGTGFSKSFSKTRKFGRLQDGNPGIKLSGGIMSPNEIFKEGKDYHVGFSTYKLRHIKFGGC